MVWALLAASEVTTASKQPQRSSLTSDLKSVTPITYLSMCILLIWYGTFWQPPRSLQPPNSLGGQVWPNIWNQWPQLPTYPHAYRLYDMDPFSSLEVTTASKQPRRSSVTSYFKSVTSITHVALSIWPLTAWISKMKRRRRKMIHWPACFAAGKNKGVLLLTRTAGHPVAWIHPHLNELSTKCFQVAGFICLVSGTIMEK